MYIVQYWERHIFGDDGEWFLARCPKTNKGLCFPTYESAEQYIKENHYATSTSIDELTMSA